MTFSVIAAADKNRGIGKDGKIPWNLKGDMAHFKEVTTRPNGSGKLNAVIMGRGTWDSLPERFRPLPGRLNVVLSRQAGLALPSGVIQAPSLDGALQALGEARVGGVFVIGGGTVYAEAVRHSQCRTVYLTEVEDVFACDTFFPQLPPAFQKVNESEPATEHGVRYRFVTYQL